MKICLNYYGQNRDINITKYTFENFIKSDNVDIEYYILYTTWDTENTNEFKELFQNSFIEQIEYPNLNNYKFIIDNYKMDPTNPNKTIEHYLLGLYIKKMSYKTIEKFEECNNINFDFIISLRTSIYLYDNHLSVFYNDINQNLINKIYVAKDPCFDVHPNQPALPDIISIANKNITKKQLEQIDVLDNCLVIGTNFFHPESSFFNILKHHKIDIISLNFRAFPQSLY
jgi:hypothetical protein